MYPTIRLRRNRRTSWIRDLVAESTLAVENLILPLFVVEGHDQRQEIKTMPNVFRLSIDHIIQVARHAQGVGIKAIALFPCIDSTLKTEDAVEAYNLDNLICRTIRSLRRAEINIGIICDVALDPYTTHSHDGIVVEGGEVHNDKTIEALCNQAIVLAKAGADIIAPSDMMDGRIIAIRKELDNAGFENVNILAYAAKYNSCFYGPFRDALNNKSRGLCKATYQMDIRNIKEAMREIEHDIAEGADMVIVKPGMPFLDVIYAASSGFDIRVFAYQVTGEYAMLKLAAQAGALDWESAIIESLMAFRRAGASAILSYAALEVAEILNNRK